MSEEISIVQDDDSIDISNDYAFASMETVLFRYILRARPKMKKNYAA